MPTKKGERSEHAPNRYGWPTATTLVAFGLLIWTGVQLTSRRWEGISLPTDPPRPSAANGAVAVKDEVTKEHPARSLIGGLLRTAGAELPETATDLDTGDQLLRDLKFLFGSLQGMENQVAVGTLDDFLKSGLDAELPFVFGVGEGGVVELPTSVRVAALDFLGRIDPEAAQVAARNVFEDSDNPDEWAVSLRNYAWANSRQTDAFFQDTLVRYLENKDWLSLPTAGYLHGFDAATVAGGAATGGRLVELASPEYNDAVRYAAFLTLDRMASTDKVAVLSALSTNPVALADLPERRARLFARTDLVDPVQVRLLEQYVATLPDATEARAFASNFPNFDCFVYPALLSEAQPPKRSDVVRRDQEALAAVEAWLAAPPGGEIMGFLAPLRDRLIAFRDSARTGDTQQYQELKPATLPE